MITAVAALLYDYRELVLGFNTFLPAGYGITHNGRRYMFTAPNEGAKALPTPQEAEEALRQEQHALNQGDPDNDDNQHIEGQDDQDEGVESGPEGVNDDDEEEEEDDEDVASLVEERIRSDDSSDSEEDDNDEVRTFKTFCSFSLKTF